MESKYVGTYPTGTWHYKGPLAEIRALSGPEGSLGHPTDSRLELRYRNGAWEALENGAVDLDTGAESVNGQTWDPSTGNTAFAGEVAVPTLVATASISAPVVNGAAYNASTKVTEFDGAVDFGKLATLADLANLPGESSINGVSSGLIYNHATGQKIFDGNKLFSAYVADASAFTAASESTVITPVVIASQHNVDGKYNRLSKHKIPPVIRAGFMAAKEDIIHSHFEMGGNFSTTPTGKILTIREYWLQPNDTATKMLEIVIDGANLAAWTSGSNRPIHIFADYNIDNIVSASSQKVRVHWRIFVGKFSSGQFWDAGESFFSDYPICNLSVENRIKWTAQWNTIGGTLYADNLEYWL